jgi:hypothetical protein
LANGGCSTNSTNAAWQVLALIALSRKFEINHSQIATSAACILTFVGSRAVLSITGLWWHHRQILYIPSIVVVVSLTSLLDASAEIAPDSERWGSFS